MVRIAEWVPRAPGLSAVVGQGSMRGRVSVAGTGDLLCAGPGAPYAAWAVPGTGDPRKGARGASLPRERCGGVAGKGTLQCLGSW